MRAPLSVLPCAQESLSKALRVRTKFTEVARAATLLRDVPESIPNATAGRCSRITPNWHGPTARSSGFGIAIALLRECRGDGHIAALVANGLSGLEALITHAATGIGLNPDYTLRLRGCSHDEWNAATEGFISRGILGGVSEVDDGPYRVAVDDRRPHRRAGLSAVAVTTC
jgi:hypothetical protein